MNLTDLDLLMRSTFPETTVNRLKRIEAKRAKVGQVPNAKKTEFTSFNTTEHSTLKNTGWQGS